MSDSDSDSDYAPGREEEEGLEEVAGARLAAIPAYRRHQTDEIFADMQRDEETFLASIRLKKESLGSAPPLQLRSQPSKQTLQMLSSIFGSSRAAAMTHESRGRKRPREEDSSAVRSSALEAAKRVKRHVKVSETVKFAGQTISVQKTVMSDNKPSTAAAAPSQGIDKVIDDIKGPKAISTVTKSSLDWDNFKEKEGIEDDLATASKGTKFVHNLMSANPGV